MPTQPRAQPIPARPAGLDATFAMDLVDEPEGAPESLSVRPVRSLPDPPVRTLPPLQMGAGLPLFETGLLGEGGMGEVHTARDTVLEREVAVKRPLLPMAAGATESLVAEARTLARLDHPNVVPVHALGLDENVRPSLVMKRITGKAWGAAAAEGLSLERNIEVALEVLNALRLAHSLGLLHLDIKPDNVMVGEFGEVYLMDWGCARALGSTTGSPAGTPAFMCPEMLERGKPLTPATDVFLMGATLHRVITGAARHRGKRVRDVLDAAWACEPAVYGPDVPAELGALLNHACARDPNARYPTADALGDALRGFRAHREIAKLAEDALGTVGELERVVARDSPEAETLFAESWVALRTALRAWPECEAAQSGMARALDAYLPWKLGRGEVDGVEATLSGTDPDTRLRWAPEIARIRSERRAREADMHDADLRVSARERRNALVIITASSLVGFVVISASFGVEPFTPGQTIFTGVLAVVILGLGILPFRKALFANRVSGALIAGIAILDGMSLVSRVAGWWAGTPVSDTLRMDLFWTAAGLLMLSRLGEPSIAFAAVPYAVIGLATLSWPDAAGSLYGIAAVGGSTIGAMIFVRRARQSPRADAGLAGERPGPRRVSLRP